MRDGEHRKRQWMIVLSCFCAAIGAAFGVWAWAVFCLALGLLSAPRKTHAPTQRVAASRVMTRHDA